MEAGLAQLAARESHNLKVVGSSPTFRIGLLLEYLLDTAHAFFLMECISHFDHCISRVRRSPAHLPLLGETFH